MRPAVHRLLPGAAAAVLAGALALLGPAPAALAHANLTRADPPPGHRLPPAVSGEVQATPT